MGLKIPANVSVSQLMEAVYVFKGDCHDQMLVGKGSHGCSGFPCSECVLRDERDIKLEDIFLAIKDRLDREAREA